MEFDGIVDVRTEEEFNSGHAERATWIPLGRLENLLCALPPRDLGRQCRIAVVARTREDALTASSTISSAQYSAVCIVAVAEGSPPFPISSSRSPSTRLWRPNAFLERSIGAIESAIGRGVGTRTAVDLACGSGRDSVFLATRGWSVRGLDTNPRLLGVGRALADHERVDPALLSLEEADVTRAADYLSRAPRFSLVHVARFLHRPLLGISGDIDTLLAPGGFVVFHTFMAGCTKPNKPKHLLRPGELRDSFSSWHVVDFAETRLDDGRPVQFLCARKPPLA